MAIALADILPTKATMTHRILTTFDAATEDQYSDGLTWYNTAHHLAVRLDPEHPMRSAGVISALSPQMDWARNMFLAERTYAEGKAYGCLGTSCRKANDILNGDGNIFDILKVLNAPKTQSFAITIADPEEPNVVVIDRHAVAIALGRAATDEDMATLNRKGAYEWYADAYRAAAKQADVLPSTMQATTWVVWRETAIRVSASVRKAAGR